MRQTGERRSGLGHGPKLPRPPSLGKDSSKLALLHADGAEAASAQNAAFVLFDMRGIREKCVSH